MVESEIPFPLEVVDFGEKGRGCRATANLPKGETVLICAPVSTAVNDTLMKSVCCGCMRASQNICPKCNLVALCDRCAIPGSRFRVLHDDDCDSLQLLFSSPLFQRPFKDSRTLRLLLRLLYFRARERLGSLPPLVAPQHEAEIPDVLADGLTEVQELQDHAEDLSPQLEVTFVETAKQLKYLVASWARGSLDLYVALLSRYYCNAFELESSDRGWVGVGLFPSASFFNHSCDSNCRFALNEWGFLRVFTTCAVRAGEELTIPYVNPAFPVARRQARLQKHFFFRCSCALCKAGNSRDETGRVFDTRSVQWDASADSDNDAVAFASAAGSDAAGVSDLAAAGASEVAETKSVSTSGGRKRTASQERTHAKQRR